MPSNAFQDLVSWAQLALFKPTFFGGGPDTTEKEKDDEVYWEYSSKLPQEVEKQRDIGKNNLTKKQKDDFIKALGNAEKNSNGKLKIKGQTDTSKSIEQAIAAGAHDFGFYIEYSGKAPFSISESSHSRLTLSFDFSKSPEAFELIAEYMEKHKDSQIGKAIREVKVLGPDVQGTRTDNAIFYLNTSDADIIERIQKDMTRLFQIAKIELYDHTPLGMGKVAKGISYSQEDPIKSSHGRARSAIVVKTVEAFMKDNSQPIETVLKRVLKESGYNEDDPTRLDMSNYLEHYRKIEVPMDRRRELLKNYLGGDEETKDYLFENTHLFGRELVLALEKGVVQEANIEAVTEEILVEASVRKLWTLFGKNEMTESVEEEFRNALSSYYKAEALKEQLQKAKELHLQNVERLQNEPDTAKKILIYRKTRDKEKKYNGLRLKQIAMNQMSKVLMNKAATTIRTTLQRKKLIKEVNNQPKSKLKKIEPQLQTEVESEDKKTKLQIKKRKNSK